MRLIWCGSMIASALALLAATPARAAERIAFAVAGDVASVRSDGTDYRNLTLSPGAEDQPTWAPDGTRIAYTSGGNVWVMDADGTGKHVLINTTERILGVDWARDGRIAFVGQSLLTGVRALRITDTSGRRPRFVTANVGQNVLDVSPDGRRILYDGAGGDLFVADVLGQQEVHRLTVSAHPTTSGAWSPDGSRVAYAGCGDLPDCDDPDIWVIGADGTGAARLTTGVHADADPAWSADGRQIAYSRFVPEVGVLGRIMDADGANDHGLDGTPAGVGALEWEPAPEPIILVPGFLGSKLACGNEELWPGFRAQQLLDLRLAADGATNLGETACGATAAPTGEPVLATQTEDVYGSTVEFLRSIQLDSRVYAWDWRRSPADALAGLDLEVERARCRGDLPPGVTTCADPHSEHVVLMGHGMGGLVTRAYIDDPARAAKVARALTIGTAYWGSAKAMLPLAAGIEAPGPPGLDPLLSDDALRELARNLAGEYALWPSASYGPWLTVPGRSPAPLDRPALLDYVGSALGGNPGLLARELDLHASTLDGFETNGVDYQVLAGAGRNTIRGLTLAPSGELVADYGNGDGTVPIESAVQGAAGTADPLGEDVPIHYACGLGNTALPGTPAVTERIRDFLILGSPIVPDAGPCAAGGFQIDFRIEVAGQAPPVQHAVPIDEAARQDLVDELDFGARKLIVTDARAPVALAVSAARYTLQVTPIGPDGAKGAPLDYGPLSGEATLAAGTELHVLQGGREVLPNGGGATPPPGGGGGPSPPGPPAGPPGAAPPRLTGLRVSPARFRALRRGASVVPRRGARVAYTLSRAAAVRFGVERRATGHRSGGRCRAGRPREGGRRCTRFVRLSGSFTHAGRAGRNTLRFSGRLRARSLRAGRYRLVATPAAGIAKHARFAIRR